MLPEVSKRTLNMLLANVNTAERALSLLDLHYDGPASGTRLESFLSLSLASFQALPRPSNPTPDTQHSRSPH